MEEKYDKATRLFEEAKMIANLRTAKSEQVALEKFEQARLIYQEINAQPEEALCLERLGNSSRSLADKRKALDYYAQALPLYLAIGDKQGEIGMLISMRIVYSDLGEKEQALKCEEALSLAHPSYSKEGKALYDKAGELFKEAWTLADAETNTPESIQTALEKFEQVRLIYQELKHSEETNCLAEVGHFHNSLGDKQKALDYYAQAVQLLREDGDKEFEASMLIRIAEIYVGLGEKEQALKYLNEALPLARANGEKSREASSLCYLAGVYVDLDENEHALIFYKEALALYRAEALDNYGRSLQFYYEYGDPAGEIRTLKNIASVYSALGEKKQALNYYEESLALIYPADDKHSKAAALNDIDVVYSDFSEVVPVLVTKIESLFSLVPYDKSGQVMALNKIAQTYADLGEIRPALKYFNEALKLSRAVGDENLEDRMEDHLLFRISKIYEDLGEKQQALKFYKELLLLYRAVGDKAGEAVTLNHIGAVYFELGEKQQALKCFNESLPLSRSTEDKLGEALSLKNLFNSFTTLNPRFSVFYGKQLINNYQIQRSIKQERHKKIQQSFLKSVEDTYIRLADALRKQERHAEARQVLEFSRSEQFAPLAFTVREAELTAAFNQKLEKVVAALRTLDEYKRGIGERAPTAEEAAQLQSLADEQTTANDDYLTFLKLAEREFAAPLEDKDQTPVISDLTQM